MYKEAAEHLANELEDKLGNDYTPEQLEELLRAQMDLGLITPKTTGDYNLKKKIAQIRKEQKKLPQEERISNRQINEEIAGSMNLSYTTVYNIARDI
jgi:hypothetical protein